MTEEQIKRTTIETPRLRLRPLETGDAVAITRLANNWNVVRNLSLLPYPYERRHATEWLEHVERRAVTTGFAVCLRGEGQPLIGVMGFAPPEGGAADEFGYWFGEPYWGNGYGTEAAMAVIEYGFEHLAVQVFDAGCRPCNPASRHLLEKCGFVKTGKGTMPSKALGTDVEIDVMELTRAAWDANPRVRQPVTITVREGCALSTAR